ncbi:MAG: YidH family protein [Acidimicrobiales bacterium]
MAAADDSARVRDRLASDRTLLAWLRTGISLAGLGFVVAKFGLFLEKLDSLAHTAPKGGNSQAHLSGYLGVALVAVAALIMAIGFVQHRGSLRQEHIAPGAPKPAEWPIVVASAGCLITTVVLAAYLVSTG